VIAEDPDRLGKRELALRHLACAVRFYFLVDWKHHLFQTCVSGRPFGGPVVCGSLYLLDVLSARIATNDIGYRTENRNTGSRDTAAARPRFTNRSSPARQSGEDNFATTGQFAVAICEFLSCVMCALPANADICGYG